MTCSSTLDKMTPEVGSVYAAVLGSYLENPTPAYQNILI